MALVTVQRSPSPTNTPESEDPGEDEVDDPNAVSPGRQRRSKSTLKRLRKFFHTVRFISKLRPCFSESYFAVRGAALILPQSDSECTYSITKKISRNSNEGDIQTHLQSMFYLLRPQDTIKVAVKLESLKGERNRYMAVVSTNGKQDTEESVILGIDCDDKATIGLVVPIYANTTMKLDGDGGFQIVAEGHPFGFKPVSVQAMWSALQSLNKVLKIASDNMYLSRGLTHTWIGYYKSRINSERAYITEWNTNEDIEFFRSMPIIQETDDEEAALKKQIRVELKNVMMKVDLDNVTSRYLREQVEETMGMNLKEYRGFIDQQMLQILGQMDSPTLVKDFLYLGSEWNASNMDELQNNGVGYILNISKEIDNFFPAGFTYMNVREWDSEETDLLPYWEDTYKFIAEARANDSKVLVHCKMGISRSASTVIAFCMKEYEMSRQEAYDYVKDLRSCIMPNSAFWSQLETYEGILTASKQRHLFKVRSEQNMQKPPTKSAPETPEEPGPFLGQNLPLFDYSHVCHSADLEESVFWHPDKRSDDDGNNDACPLEPDFEISSRSADSTEELLPDNLSPTPDTASGIIKTASGVYYFKDPIISKDKLDSDDSGDEGADLVTDKNVSSADALKESSCSMEVPSQSIPKIKPDRSWIRESSTDDLDPGGGTENVDKSKSDSIEGAEASENIEEGMIYFKADPTVDDKGTSADSVFIHGATVSESTTDDSPPGIDHYIKENIPWNLGKVKKQKEDLEGKLKDSKSESIDSSDGIVILVDGVPFVDQSDADKSTSKQEVVKSHDQADTKDDELQKGNKADKTEKALSQELTPEEQDVPLKRPASVYEMEDIQLPEGIVKRTTQEIEDRNRSIDDLTKSPGRPLKRSSSLKDERVTPKNKRSSERRKTCTPILSPTTPSDTSPAKEVSKSELESSFLRDKTAFDLPIQSVKSHDIDNTQNTICDNKDSVGVSDNHDLESPATDLAVYKFLGEEVSVEKGIVKKQKMGIEQKNRERTDSDNKDSGTTAVRTESKSPTSPTSNTASENTSALKSDQKVPQTEEEIQDNSKQVCDNVGAVKPSSHDKTEIDSDNIKQKQTHVKDNEIKDSLKSESQADFSAKSSKITERERKCLSPSSERKDSQPNSTQSTPVFSRKKQKSESEKSGRFDAETLELIREIGSALLNSPAKSELDEDEQDGQEGVGLVKRFVRNIEKQTRAVKKRHAREVIIIEKESQKKKPWQIYTTESQETSGSSSPLSANSQSAAELVPNICMSRSTSSPTSLTGDKKSSEHESHIHDQKQKVPENTSAKRLSPFEKDSSSKSPDSHVVDTQLVQSVISTSPQEMSEVSFSEDNQNKDEIKGVKTLVGKFESTDKPPTKTVSLLSPSEKPPEEIEIVSTSSADKIVDKCSSKSPPGAYHHASDDQSSWEDMTSDSSTEGTAHLRQLRQNLRKTSYGCRPKSAEHYYRSSSYGHYMPEYRRSRYQHARALSENVDSGPMFTWEGKKIRKLHGKNHPLTKLESKRKGPFYNTM